jgi:hypothetical protein
VAPALTPAPRPTAVRPCSHHYGSSSPSANDRLNGATGANAFSEPEQSALAEYIKSQANVRGYIDWHSYSQLILGVPHPPHITAHAQAPPHTHTHTHAHAHAPPHTHAPWARG